MDHSFAARWYFNKKDDSGGSSSAREQPQSIPTVSVVKDKNVTLPTGRKDAGAIGEDTPSITMRVSLSDYSWEELKGITGLMQHDGTRQGALHIAEQYHLIDASGTFQKTTKSVALKDGAELRMRLVDVMHNPLGQSGPASMTFIATNAAYRGRMPKETTTSGGWQSSEGRTLLSTTVQTQLPTDVAEAIVPVRKMPNNVGKTLSDDCVTSTSDFYCFPQSSDCVVRLIGSVLWMPQTRPTTTGCLNKKVFNTRTTLRIQSTPKKKTPVCR